MLSPLPTPTPYDTSSPEPYYRDDWTTLYFGDCQDILPHLPAVDVVITDPLTTSTHTPRSDPAR